MRMNKKATYTADTAPFYMVFAVVVSFLFIAFVFIIQYYSTYKVESPSGLNEYLLYQRFFRSSDCFAYEDISGRVYPFVIDSEKFKQENLERCYNSDANLPAFKLKLELKGKITEIKTTNWNNQIGPKKIEKPYTVLVYHDNAQQKGEMTIEMQNV